MHSSLNFILDDYVNFDPVMKWNDFYSMFLAAVLFIAIMQLFKPMDFSQQAYSPEGGIFQ